MASQDLKFEADDFRVGLGISLKKGCESAAREAVQAAWAQLPGRNVDLALVFTTPSLAYIDTVSTLTQLLGNASLIGCSSNVIITPQGFLTHGLGLALFSFTRGIFFNVASLLNLSAKSPLVAGEELGEKLLYGFQEAHRNLGIVFTDKITSQAPQLIPGLHEKLGESFPLVGIFPSDNFQATPPFMLCNRELTQDAACGVLFGGKISFGMGAGHGWKPLGKPRKVTKSFGNVVFEIEDAPAAAMYAHYFSCDIPGLQKKMKSIATFYPVGIFLPEENKYQLRTIVSIQENGALAFQGDVPQGCYIRFMIATQKSCLEATQLATQESLGGQLGNPPKFVLAFESISRYMLLGRMVRKELAIIAKDFGEGTPYLGICTNAELTPLKSLGYRGKTIFHNHMVTFLTFSAKTSVP